MKKLVSKIRTDREKVSPRSAPGPKTPKIEELQLKDLMKPALLLIACTLSLSSLGALAQEQVKYPAVYPFVPEKTQNIYGDVKRVTEDAKFLRNFNEIITRGLSKKFTHQKPWTSSYWPLSKGTIADVYEDDDLGYFLDINWLTWENNYKNFRKRLQSKLSNVDQMSEEELAKLAPSEKYDLLLGDKAFDLTRRLWEYMHKWGSQKELAFLKKNGLLLAGNNSLELAHNYIDLSYYKTVDEAFSKSWNLRPTLSAEKALDLVAKGKYRDAESAFGEALVWAKGEASFYQLEEKNSLLAAWEGICNGWATAAGLVPRPRKSISFQLPNGKKLKFYPSDIKGIVALYYVNSLVQDPALLDNNGLPSTQGTVSAGLRCNLSNPKKDLWGRFYDNRPDPKSTTNQLEARCNGVHPATWHLGVINFIGVQGRSFVVERKVGAAVDNAPIWGYDIKYFNPYTGKFEKDLNRNIERIDQDDQFRPFRNKAARYIVGVENTVTYVQYAKPKRKDLESEKDDKEVKHEMLYDLELDENFNIVGGQWRAIRVGQVDDDSSSLSMYNEKGSQHQPNFFWSITKNYKDTGWFGDRTDIAPWTDKRLAPPSSWVKTAHGYHEFMYQQTVDNGGAATCHMKHKKTGKVRKVVCELETNKPQPLVNVVNALIELSK